MSGRFVDLDGVRLHVVVEGDGPLVVLLHGFPDFWRSWRHQLAALAGAGFVVAAPDLRGYNLSGKPGRVSDYRLSTLAADVDGLIRALGHDRAHLVGHDWGGAVAWEAAGRYPRRVESLAVLNCPHPAIMARRLLRPPQLFRSWYMFVFQLPVLPERWVVGDSFIEAAFRGLAIDEDVYTDDELRRVREAIRRPGAARAALNYYRAAFRHPAPSAVPIACRTLVVWGERDRALGAELLEGTDRIVSNLRVHRIPDAGHWVHHERPDEVNRLLLDHLVESR